MTTEDDGVKAEIDIVLAAAEDAKRRRLLPLQIRCDEWNMIHAIGTPVVYTKDDGTPVGTRTRTNASVLGEHTAVIWLADIAGCVDLDRVEPGFAGLCIGGPADGKMVKSQSPFFQAVEPVPMPLLIEHDLSIETAVVDKVVYRLEPLHFAERDGRDRFALYFWRLETSTALDAMRALFDGYHKAKTLNPRGFRS